jgi:hypothetical protein
MKTKKICIGDVMATQQSQELFAQAAAGNISPAQHMRGERSAELWQLEHDWQGRMRNLQGWICELLIQNQQLRMSLDVRPASSTRRPAHESCQDVESNRP